MPDEPEGIDVPAVTEWLVTHLEDLVPPVRFSQVAGGHSNLTYTCQDTAGQTYVLRRPPMGKLLESAHDMGREHRIIRALADSPVPVPRARGLCEDREVNGAPFYIMDFVKGEVLHDAEAAAVLSMEERLLLSREVVQVLANLHAIDPDQIGLGKLGRKEAYLGRQLNRWARQWEASRTHAVPEMEESARLLRKHMPEQVGSSLVHGDYRLGNMLTAQGKVFAVLDWELCTLGDPLADVGYLLNNWAPPEEALSETSPPTTVGGFASRDNICTYYTGATGKSLEQIDYYRAFSYWRSAAIGQGVYKRYVTGIMGGSHDVDIPSYKEKVELNAGKALKLLLS